MSREQIIKALECCIDTMELMRCQSCPYYDKKSCHLNLKEDALSLIKELTEENKAWQKRTIYERENEGKAYYNLACEVEDLRKENERMRAELEQRPTKLIITKLPKKERGQ